jgi:hypothetical protein
MQVTSQKSTKNVIKGIHAVNRMEQLRELRNNKQFSVKIVNGKTIIHN